MTIHRLKTDRPHYQDVIDGVKTYEIRLNDRGYRRDDTLILQERDPQTGRLTGREHTVIVTDVLPRAHRWHTFTEIEEHGLAVLTIRPAHGAYEGSSLSPTLQEREVPPERLQRAARLLRERFSLAYSDLAEDERRRYYEQIARQILQLP